MKDQRKSLTIAAAAAACILATVPVCASTSSDTADGQIRAFDGIEDLSPEDPAFWAILDAMPSDPGPVSYVVDLLDWDGEILDSRICQYGDRLDDVRVPETWTDGEYTYQFSRWDPELPEIITGSMAFTAVYQKTTDSVSCPDMPEQETSDPITKAASDRSNDIPPDRVTQVSSTSYDVTRFHVETPTPSPEAAAPPTGTPLPQKTAIEGPSDPEDPGPDADPIIALLAEMNVTITETPTEIPHPSPAGLTERTGSTFSLQSDPDPYAEEAADEDINASEKMIDTPAPAQLQTESRTKTKTKTRTRTKTRAKTDIKKSRQEPVPISTGQIPREPQATSCTTPLPERSVSDISPLHALLASSVISSGTLWLKNKKEKNR